MPPFAHGSSATRQDSALVIGVDPGITTGVCLLWPGLGVQPVAVQWQPDGVVPYVRNIIDNQPPCDLVVLAIEQFVVSTRASKSGHANAGGTTRTIISALSDLAGELRDDYNIVTVLRNAATVKPWATDRRLEAAGLLEVCKGMGHARDAARHALYAAVHLGVATDPLSSKAVS